ncbi:MAG TPA: hypothetical protein VL049_14080, partial [Candidatus Dormibacteraeota bacterium]|nr:hypothetical protein [Candidatus Dormibacteraeota bacterium]
RGSTPGDPLNGKSTASDIDFVFGDENVPATPTPTETRTSSPTATPSPTAAETPTAVDTPTAPAATPTAPVAIAGDCDGDGTVSVAELVRAVGIALETLPVSMCPAADRDGDGAVRIEELIAALNAALATAG